MHSSNGYATHVKKELVLNPATGLADHAIEGESMKVISVSRGKVSIQDMSNFHGDQWSGGKQLFWSGAEPRARLHLEFAALVLHFIVSIQYCVDPLDLRLCRRFASGRLVASLRFTQRSLGRFATWLARNGLARNGLATGRLAFGLLILGRFGC